MNVNLYEVRSAFYICGSFKIREHIFEVLKLFGVTVFNSNFNSLDP